VSEANHIRRERTFVCVFLFAICLTLAHFVHSAWFLSVPGNVAKPPSVPVQSGPYAPDAYRVAMAALVPFLQNTFHVADRTSINGVLDFCFGFGALFLLYRLSVDDRPTSETNFMERFAVVALFLALVQFPMAWVVPWQRPETMPSAFYLALALFCVSRRGRKWLGLLLLATCVQALVRSDVALVFGIAMMLTSFWRPVGSRLASFFAGMGVAVIAGGVQMYLQFVRFPHLTYPPGTPMIQFSSNLQLHSLGVFAIGLLPLLLVGAFLIYKRPSLTSVDALVIAAALLYLPLWFTMGNIAEVRIFVPFLLAICMVGARVAVNSVATVNSE
jgi:hypothetical protein